MPKWLFLVMVIAVLVFIGVSGTDLGNGFAGIFRFILDFVRAALGGSGQAVG